MEIKKNEVVELSFKFALEIIAFSEELENHKKFVIARQILLSGTSIGANVREAQSAESKADFIHKFKIAHKEAVETDYWLALVKSSKNYPDPVKEIEQILVSITKLLNKIIATSKKKTS